MGTIALIVEQLSPGHRVSEVNRRVHRFMRAGVPEVWLVDPEERAVTVYRAGAGFRVLEGADELPGDNSDPELRCRASEFFTPPGQNQGDVG